MGIRKWCYGPINVSVSQSTARGPCSGLPSSGGSRRCLGRFGWPLARRLRDQPEDRQRRATAMKGSPAVDHVIEHEHAVDDAGPNAATKDRGVAALGAAHPQAMSFEQFVDRGGDLAVGQQRPERFARPIGQRLLDRQPHRSLQPVQLPLQIIELDSRVIEVARRLVRNQHLDGWGCGGRVLERSRGTRWRHAPLIGESLRQSAGGGGLVGCVVWQGCESFRPSRLPREKGRLKEMTSLEDGLVIRPTSGYTLCTSRFPAENLTIFLFLGPMLVECCPVFPVDIPSDCRCFVV